MVPPVQLILSTASVTGPPSDFRGVASCRFSTVAFQPGMGCTAAKASGWLAGNATSIPVVEASLRSFGMLNESSVSSAPASALDGMILTCADAGPAPNTRAPPRAAVNKRARDRVVQNLWVRGSLV